MADSSQTIKELQDALTVTAGRLLNDHSEWLASHDRAMTEIREAGRATDARIEKLVVAIGELIAQKTDFVGER